VKRQKNYHEKKVILNKKSKNEEVKMKKVFINKKKLIVVLLLTILITTSLFVSFNNKKSFVSTQSAKATSSNVSSSPCGCNEKPKLNEIYDTPSEIELKSLISTTKSQRIYKDYSEFLKNKGYAECTNSIFGGFFKKTPVIKKDVRYGDKNNDFKFSYGVNLKVKRPYILSVPFINAFDDNKIAGIIFVYSQKRVLSYMVEVDSIKDPKSMSVDILIENNNGEIASASNIATPDFYINWHCVWSCIPGALYDCLQYIPIYPICAAVAWGICYDFCAIFP